MFRNTTIQVALTTFGLAARGGEVVAQVVDVIGDMSSSSTRIVDISARLGASPFQPNILALNAAVEAHHAELTEQGIRL